MKSIPSKSPIRAVNGRLNPKILMNQEFHDSFLSTVSLQDSISQLSLCVNDSAGNTTFEECYEKKEMLGQGGFADVFLCTHKHNAKDYAVKEIYNDNYENYGENIRLEINAMKRLREGCYIIRLFDVFRENDKTYMIMEEMKGGDLLERIYKVEVFCEQDARRLARKLLEAIRFCHKKKVAHRDIKPENILLTSKKSDTDIRLADFGCARFITGPNCLKTLCGSTCYAAPELYTHKTGYNEKCDNWSAGIVIYVLLGGYLPFDGPEDDLPEMIQKGKFTFHYSYWKDISDESKNVIRGLLKVDPNERSTVEQALDSEWLRRRCVESLGNMDGSISAFDAWVRRQNESSQTISYDGSCSIANGCIEENDDDDDKSECSLSIADLYCHEELDEHC